MEDEVKSSVMGSSIDTNGKHNIVAGFLGCGEGRSIGLANCLCLLFLVSAGCHRGETSRIQYTQVVGASMSPTFWGEHRSLQCTGCGITWQANWQPEMRPSEPITCWNCGHLFNLVDGQAELGEIIAIDPSAYSQSNASPQLSDVVAIQDANGFRLKRIVAIPGQTVWQRDGDLFRDDQPMTTLAPWNVVHDHSFRHQAKSWWLPVDSVQIMQTDEGFRIAADADSGQEAKLIYQHRSPYDELRPDRVRDDYSGNLVERRRLRDVQTLAVRAQIDVIVASTIHWWCWRDDGIVKETTHLPVGLHPLHVQWSERHLIAGHTPAGLDAKQPICLVIETGTIVITKLIVERPINYWIDDTAARTIALPIILQSDEYFVIGDNIPLSIDSRHHGVVKLADIVGKAK